MKVLAALLMAGALLTAFPRNLAALKVEQQIQAAKKAMDEGRLDDARHDLEMVLSKKRRNQDAKILLGLVRYRQALVAQEGGNFQQAADELRAAIALDPDEAYWHAALAQALARQGDKAAAGQECSLAAHLSPLDSGLAAGCKPEGNGRLGAIQSLLSATASPKAAPIDVWPVPLQKPEPPYTDKAREIGLQGATVLEVEIGADGAVESARVIKPLCLGMDEEALKTVRKWTFKPAMRDGKPVPTRFVLEVSFRMF